MKEREKEVHPPPLHCEISVHRNSTLFRQKVKRSGGLFSSFSQEIPEGRKFVQIDL